MDSRCCWVVDGDAVLFRNAIASFYGDAVLWMCYGNAFLRRKERKGRGKREERKGKMRGDLEGRGGGVERKEQSGEEKVWRVER